MPLNQLLAKSGVGAVDAIKMDIEGAKRSALDGARHSRANVCASAI